MPELAAKLGVCAASYVTLDQGKPSAPLLISGCAPSRPLHAAPVFQAASLTKPVIAFVALNMSRKGLLDLQAPVSRYLPNGYRHRKNPFGDVSDTRGDLVTATTLARISIASLLNHSSGLPNWTSDTLVPEFEPGTRWQYSGEGYVLLQTILSAVSAQDIESLVSQYVFEPLDMPHTRLRLTDDIRAQLVDGTSWFGGVRQFHFREANAAASLYTTASDYAKLLAAWLADAELLSMTLANPVAIDPALGLSWGYGLGIESAAGGPYLWQWANNPGFRAFARVSASSKSGFVLLTNSERGMPLAAPLARLTIPAEHGVFRFHALG